MKRKLNLVLGLIIMMGVVPAAYASLDSKWKTAKKEYLASNPTASCSEMYVKDEAFDTGYVKYSLYAEANACPSKEYSSREVMNLSNWLHGDFNRPIDMNSETAKDIGLLYSIRGGDHIGLGWDSESRKGTFLSLIFRMAHREVYLKNTELALWRVQYGGDDAEGAGHFIRICHPDIPKICEGPSDAQNAESDSDAEQEETDEHTENYKLWGTVKAEHVRKLEAAGYSYECGPPATNQFYTSGTPDSVAQEMFQRRSVVTPTTEDPNVFVITPDKRSTLGGIALFAKVDTPYIETLFVVMQECVLTASVLMGQ